MGDKDVGNNTSSLNFLSTRYISCASAVKGSSNNTYYSIVSIYNVKVATPVRISGWSILQAVSAQEENPLPGQP